MAPWLNNDCFDNKKTKDVKEEMLRYEYGEKKSPLARFSHLHLPGLGAGMMAASKNFSIGDHRHRRFPPRPSPDALQASQIHFLKSDCL